MYQIFTYNVINLPSYNNLKLYGHMKLENTTQALCGVLCISLCTFYILQYLTFFLTMYFEYEIK